MRGNQVRNNAHFHALGGDPREVDTNTNVPHSGSLCRIRLRSEDEKPAKVKTSFIYAITIRNSSGNYGYNADDDDHYHRSNKHTTIGQTYQLQFSPDQYTFLQNIFEILDTESIGVVHKNSVRNFVMLRCPVFKRRDADLKHYHENKSNANTRTGESAPAPDLLDIFAFPLDSDEAQTEFDSQPEEGSHSLTTTTFDQVWDAVVSSALNYNRHHVYTQLGVEGWMLFCRFIALAQYHDAKRRFSARHLQTVQNKNEQEPSELIIVDLPPLLEPPTPLDIKTLVEYDYSARTNRKSSGYGSGSGSGDFDQNSIPVDGVGEGMPLPELDLDHSYISIYDDSKKMKFTSGNAKEHTSSLRESSSMPLVRVSVFGSNHLNMFANAAGASPGSSTSNGGNLESLEFVIKYLPNGDESKDQDVVIVRRSFDDLEWLDQTFKSHKPLGGTLCGRILPPFPSRLRSSGSDFGVSDNLYQKRNAANSTAVAVASASVSAGVGIVSSAAKTAKSLWGSLPGSKQISKIVKTKVQSPGVKHVQQTFPKTSYSMKNTKNSYETPESKARQIEKYLNYMLKHPALSTSFPLNLILKASQSGLEAAKRILKDQSQKSNDVSFHGEGARTIEDEKILSLRASVFQYLPSPNQTKNLEWVRSAAQAALVLRLPGLLETAGYQSTSTTLQHASLPQFAHNISHEGIEPSTFDGDMEENAVNRDDVSCIDNDSDDECDGFDILPDPLPFPDRSALCAGNVYPTNTSDNASYSAYSSQDRYGIMQNTTLGDMEVERDIDRLRELLRRVDKSFASCCNALIEINEHRRSRDLLHVNILRNIDNWNGMRGKILSQRALLNGVMCLEDASCRTDTSYANFKEDMLWTASLASAAYSASKDVCGAVEAARTASRAKRTADIAVQNATQAEREVNGTLEETKILQERVSRSQMQALHAAVVEHEAASAKRRSVVSLANDVKYWNTHRKRDLITACSQVVKEQKLSAAQNVKAWTQLKQGLLDSPSIFDVGQNSQHESSRVQQSTDPETKEPNLIESQTPQTDRSHEIQTPSGNIVVATTLQDYFSPSASLRHDDDFLPPIDYESSLASREAQHSISSESEEALVFSDALSSSALSHESINASGQLSVSDGDNECEDDGRQNDNNEDKNDMTESMQSLVDGLLTWGGGGNWDVEDELGLALPKGMATSLAMEERGILDLA